ncbi:hypothetical protein KC19_3G188200, partial [Ceratodon purpureus]
MKITPTPHANHQQQQRANGGEPNGCMDLSIGVAPPPRVPGESERDKDALMARHTATVLAMDWIQRHDHHSQLVHHDAGLRIALSTTLLRVWSQFTGMSSARSWGLS